MRLSRVMLEGWTASFRYPRLIAGSQPSLKAPPPATVYGLVSAACGRPVSPDNTRLGYVFRYLGVFEDLEALQKIGWDDKSGNYDKLLMPDIVHREILYEWTLFLTALLRLLLHLENPATRCCWAAAVTSPRLSP